MNLKLELFSSGAFPPSLSTVYRSMPGDTEVDLAERFFAGKRLADVNRDSLLRAYRDVTDMSSIPVFLSDAAFAFFLPALMQAALDGQAEMDTQLPEFGDALCRELLRIAEGGGSYDSRRESLLAMYSADQLREVSRFLRQMRDHDKLAWPEGNLEEWDVAAQALDLFWNKFV